MLARPLLPGEIVHHRDGHSLNNALENLLVLPSQRYHAHIEYHLRCEKRGQPLLFPELLHPVRQARRGTFVVRGRLALRGATASLPGWRDTDGLQRSQTT